ncbi:PAQR family membrane homeostasis protein TrhA [Salisediminibacterium selenitireducens]|uniref:Channel protein, hemolysin III family n=1 Tax=Bacillus selenitireducens (strain ATCC 700615 / DSM 15326 / MLS10) TaxID=439292 RepID=D6XXE2_BACIE|nr:hemolysin III family protein [Salisediminibacterium selenitireducens]ADH97999.1 channel protein, hemolysin III family [[Bacillus] selenitireducens MLS10]
MHTFIREPVNSLTHWAGAVLSLIGLVAMLFRSSEAGFGTLEIAAVTVFGLSLILLYTASATYHMIIASDSVIAFFRRLDHSMIYILIAGTYTPFCLIAMQGPAGWALFGIVTAMAIAGVTFKLIWFHSPRWLSTGIYIGMGWLIVFFVVPLTSVIDPTGLVLLVAGGVLYTIGGVLYAIKPDWSILNSIGFHEVFHLFILFGSLAHYFSVYFFVIG